MTQNYIVRVVSIANEWFIFCRANEKSTLDVKHDEKPVVKVRAFFEMSAMFSAESYNLGQLIKLEEFLSSAYVGSGHLLKKRNHTMVTETHGKDGEYFVHPKYIFELANLFLSGPKAAKVVGLVDTTIRIPRKNTEIDEPVIQLPKCFEGTTSSMSQSEIKKEERVDDYFSKISVLLPMTILTLMMNQATTEYGMCLVPVLMTQPNVNNCNVKLTDLYDKSMADMTDRTADQFGTMETAWGVGPHNMDAQKITIMFYSVSPTNSTD